MTGLASIYVQGNTPVHRADARGKIALLFAYSCALLAVSTWWGLGLLLAALAAVWGVARIPLGRMNRALVPVYVLAAFSLLFNVVGAPGVEGVARGAFLAARMVALVAASFVVCFTTTSSDLLQAFRFIIAPLRRLSLPVDDIAFTLALSVRFIAVVEDEFASIRRAQVSRGAELAGSFSKRLRIWGVAFTSLFVGLFRHADAIAVAMDARCYGARESRTALKALGASPAHVVAVAIACIAVLVVGFVL